MLSDCGVNSIFDNSVIRAKDSDITWLYGPWKSIEPSPIPPAASSQTSRQNSRHPSVTKVTKSVLKRRMTQLSIAPCTHPGNRPLRLEEEVLKTGGARAWFRLLCPEYPISKMAAWSKYIWVHTTSTKPTKVRFALEVQQCIAVNPTTTHDATYIDPKSLLQNPRSDDTFLVPGGYYPSSVHSSLFCEKRQKQTIKKLPSTGLKSSQGSIRDHRGVVDDADIAGGVFFL